jgi:oxalate decarboxylase
LRNVTPQVDRDGGSRLAVDASTFPILRGLSLYRAVLKPLGLREPHWHPNANELTYCLTGEALVTIFSNGSIHDTFSVRAGECFSSHPAIFITSKIQAQLTRNYHRLLP